MKKFLSGLILGLVLATTLSAAAGSDAIKLIVNGKEIYTDVPPQVINGRTMIPARPLAEALGATAEWDEVNNAVVVTAQTIIGGQPTDLNTIEEASDMPNNFLKGRELVELLGAKYPDMDSSIGLTQDGELQFGNQIFNLEINDDNEYRGYNITPLIEAEILP
jgi:hypothetical protein